MNKENLINKKIINIALVAMFFLAAICIILGSFLDLKISENIFSSRNGFALFYSSFGILPLYMSIGFLSGIIFGTELRNKHNTYQKIILMIVSFLGIGAGIFFFEKELSSVNGYQVTGAYRIITALIAAIVVMTPWALAFKKSKKLLDNDKIWLISLIFLLAIGIAELTAAIVIKDIMHRPRFRVLVDQAQYSTILGKDQFQNWWQVFSDYKNYIGLGQITKEEFCSFPSGHAMTSGLVIFLASYLTFYFSINSKKQITIIVACFVSWILVAASRIICGAHYLSDVGFGLLVTSITFLIVKYIVNHILFKKK